MNLHLQIPGPIRQSLWMFEILGIAWCAFFLQVVKPRPVAASVCRPFHASRNLAEEPKQGPRIISTKVKGVGACLNFFLDHGHMPIPFFYVEN